MSPSGSILILAREKLRDFEADSGFRFSSSARAILEEAVLSARGLDLPYRHRVRFREKMLLDEKPIAILDEFLTSLADRINRARPYMLDEEDVIGGIFVLQHMSKFPLLHRCTCWPE